MLNSVALMGRLVADPELRHTPNDIAVTSFTIAVDRSYAKAGTERVTDFIDIVAWRNTAEFVCRYFSKGRLIAVQGAIQTRTYQDKDGNNRKAFEVVANNVYFADSKKDSSAPRSDYNQNIESAPASFENGNNDDFKEIETEDDLPF